MTDTLEQVSGLLRCVEGAFVSKRPGKPRCGDAACKRAVAAKAPINARRPRQHPVRPSTVVRNWPLIQVRTGYSSMVVTGFRRPGTARPTRSCTSVGSVTMCPRNPCLPQKGPM